MFRNSIVPITAGVMLALAGSAQAATKTSNINVTASVASNCNITTTNMAFGAYTGAADLFGTATVGVRCTKGTTYTLTLNPGATLGATFAQRLLSDGGANTLQYNLYTDAAYTNIWGDGSPSTTVYSSTGTGLSATGQVNRTVYGKLPDNATNQDAQVGSYSDTIVASVVY
jgi:spore coat protein U-like protein